jgi:hypothetical protein
MGRSWCPSQLRQQRRCPVVRVPREPRGGGFFVGPETDAAFGRSEATGAANSPSTKSAISKTLRPASPRRGRRVAPCPPAARPSHPVPTRSITQDRCTASGKKRIDQEKWKREEDARVADAIAAIDALGLATLSERDSRRTDRLHRRHQLPLRRSPYQGDGGGDRRLVRAARAASRTNSAPGSTASSPASFRSTAAASPRCRATRPPPCSATGWRHLPRTTTAARRGTTRPCRTPSG